MKKFAVFSGFLGTGKTTTMMALSRYYSEHYGKAAMISNDLGHGVRLADNQLAQLCGCNASEMTDECICYQNENLADRLDSYYDDGYDLVFSDIPGFGVGALEHVYHGINEKFPGRYDLAPFTVVTEPKVVETLRSGSGGDLEYILDTQLVEADLIVLNKCDTVSSKQADADKKWLQDHYPAAEVLTISAVTGEGMDNLALALKNGIASMRCPDIGYGGERFGAAMGRMCEYYIQYYATVCCNDFDGNDYLMDMAARIRDKVIEAGHEIPHLKLLAYSAEGDFGKADLLGTDRKIEVTHRFENRCTEIAVILNTSADCPVKILDEIVTGTVTEVSVAYNLELVIHKQESFGMGG